MSRFVSVCPACENAARDPTGPEAPAFSEVVGKEEFRQPSYFVYECATCGLLYRDPCLDPAELARYYAEMDFRRWEISGYYPTERYTLEILRRLPAGSRILDFGCSSAGNESPQDGNDRARLHSFAGPCRGRASVSQRVKARKLLIYLLFT